LTINVQVVKIKTEKKLKIIVPAKRVFTPILKIAKPAMLLANIALVIK